MEQSFVAHIEQSIRQNWNLPALSDYKGVTYTYQDVARKIAKIHIIAILEQFSERFIGSDGQQCRQDSAMCPLFGLGNLVALICIGKTDSHGFLHIVFCCITVQP